ncbi:sugar ABC transporter [Rhizobium sp. AC44/96]|uniref:ABC transporter substrate-binding protein n=1 Tax=Rhizobium sp. AC44/96 TaxID=1841654 RepID=UPI00080FA7EB|nr:sugar ABC transporter substrate-binding protein [Rhizobium sp. AC44/96]OCJ14433.1 sugar ABC transporter [Rhizobium sp. AC44/96]
MFKIDRRSLGIALGISLIAFQVAVPANAQDKAIVNFAAASFAEPGRGDMLKAWVEKFNKQSTTVEVKPVTIPFSSFVSTIFTQMGGGAGPDIVRFDLPEFYAAVGAKRVVAIDDLIGSEKYNFTSPDKYMTIDGHRYGLPFEISNYAMIYNKALLPEGKAPATFDEFVAAAKAATANGNFGYAYRTTMAERGGMWYDLTNYVYGFGGRWSNDKGEPTINTPEVVKGVAAFKTIYDAAATPKGADAATYRRMFWEKKVAMEIDNGGIAAVLSSQAKDFKIEAAHSPFPERAQGMILAPVTVNANSKVKEAAGEFLKWMLTPDAQRELQSILGAANVATVVERTPEELAEKPWLKVYDDQTQYSVPALPAGLETKAPEIQQIVIEQVIKVLQAGVDPKDAMDEAQRQVLARVVNK